MELGHSRIRKRLNKVRMRLTRRAVVGILVILIGAVTVSLALAEEKSWVLQERMRGEAPAAVLQG